MGAVAIAPPLNLADSWAGRTMVPSTSSGASRRQAPPQTGGPGAGAPAPVWHPGSEKPERPVFVTPQKFNQIFDN